MHGNTEASHVQRATLTSLHAAAVALAAWVLFGNGLTTVGDWFGQDWTHGDAFRRTMIFACSAIYFGRVVFGTYYY